MNSEMFDPKTTREQELNRIFIQQNANEIVHLLNKYGPLTASQMQKSINAVGQSTDQLTKILASLSDVGIITLIEANKYALTDAGVEVAVRHESYIEAIKVRNEILSKRRKIHFR